MAAALPPLPIGEGISLETEAFTLADYVQKKFSKGEIDRAGQKLVEWLRTPIDTPLEDRVWLIMENWRNCHGLPLTRIRRDLGKRLKLKGIEGLVVHRLKRFSSTIIKLGREKTMKLSQMQDLGGCRAILRTVADVRAISESFRSETVTSYVNHLESTFDNYLDNPKSDGYRGVHVVCRFSGLGDEYGAWRGQRIEVQIRTKLQHAFATAVETVTTFGSTPLKFGGGSAEWKRFFSLVGSAFAIQEATALVPGTPTSHEELIGEIRKLARSLRVKRKLEAWRKMVRALPRENTAGSKWLLLSLDLNGTALSVKGFENYTLAREALAVRERAISGVMGSAAIAREDAVLVSVDSILELRKAYPNYYGDTRRFLKELGTVTARVRG